MDSRRPRSRGARGGRGPRQNTRGRGRGRGGGGTAQRPRRGRMPGARRGGTAERPRGIPRPGPRGGVTGAAPPREGRAPQAQRYRPAQRLNSAVRNELNGVAVRTRMIERDRRERVVMANRRERARQVAARNAQQRARQQRMVGICLLCGQRVPVDYLTGCGLCAQSFCRYAGVDHFLQHKVMCANGVHRVCPSIRAACRIRVRCSGCNSSTQCSQTQRVGSQLRNCDNCTLVFQI